MNRLTEIDGQRKIQFFYGAVDDTMRPSHVAYDGHEYQLYYDHRKFLMAMEREDGEMWYIASDYVGSPIAVFDRSGRVIKQVSNIVITFDSLTMSDIVTNIGNY